MFSLLTLDYTQMDGQATGVVFTYRTSGNTKMEQVMFVPEILSCNEISVSKSHWICIAFHRHGCKLLFLLLLLADTSLSNAVLITCLPVSVCCCSASLR
jgi:uncharacterized protein YpiB (UPF0302 family)